jgi:hypothetical protein
LAISLTIVPTTLILVTIFVNLDTETGFFVIFPTSDVLGAGAPLASFEGAIFELTLLLDPVNGGMWPILVSSSVIANFELEILSLGG